MDKQITHFADDATLKRLDEIELHVTRLREMERQHFELYEIVCDVAAHFDGTDAPLGIRARAALAKAEAA